MNKIIPIILISSVLSAQDEMRRFDQKTVAQMAVNKKMGRFRDEEAINVVAKQFQNISVKDKNTAFEEPARPNMIPGFDEWVFLHSNERPKFHPDE